MHIGVDATCWQNSRGYGRHARALLGALVRQDAANRYSFVMDSAAAAGATPPGAAVRLVKAGVPTAVAASARGHRSARDMLLMSRALSKPDFDVLLFPTIYSYVPVWSRAKKIVFIHDTIAETYAQLTLPKLRGRLFWNAKTALGRRQADALVTVSKYSRRCIVEKFKLPAERVFVVGEASDPVFRRTPGAHLSPRLSSLGITANNGSGARTIVYVGGFSPHKNLEALVSAFARLAGRQEFADVRLVMVGEYEKEVFHSYFSEIKRQVQELGVAGRVVFTGYLPDSELVTLLNLATVCALPSLMEGFGLPAIEAAACGCPVVATTASPLPDLLGDGGIFVAPTDGQKLEEALARVLGSSELRERMRRAGLAASGRLTWDRAAREMMCVMRQVITH